MRNKNEIDIKIRELCLKELKKRKKKYLSRCHLSCKYNSRHRIHNNGKVGFCHNPDVKVKSRGFMYVCDTIDVSEACPHFENKYTVEIVEREFYSILRDPAKCGQEYPQIHSLLWVLNHKTEELSSIYSRFSSSAMAVISSIWNFFIFRWL